MRRLNEFWVEQGEEQNLAADPKLAGVLQQMREKLEGYREGALMRTPGASLAMDFHTVAHRTILCWIWQAWLCTLT